MKKSYKKIICYMLATIIIIGFLPINKLFAYSTNSSLTNWSKASAVFVGDSITYGSKTDKTYHAYINETNTFKSVKSMGVSGSCISSQSDYGHNCSPLIDRYASIPNSDLIVIFMGTNDYSHETSLGNITDTTDISFYGALNEIACGLKTAHPDSQIVFVTPLHRYGFGTSKILGTQFTYDYIPNGKCHTLSDYVNAIKDICKKYSIPVIDLYNQYPIDPTNEAERNIYMPDGLHPNAKGHKLIADLLLLNLKIIPKKGINTIPAEHLHSYSATIHSSTCTSNGYIVYICACGNTYNEVLDFTAHSFKDGSSKCENCDFDKADNCPCNCHKGGISGFFFKIINFFQKLFGMNKNCACGAAH